MFGKVLWSLAHNRAESSLQFSLKAIDSRPLKTPFQARNGYGLNCNEVKLCRKISRFRQKICSSS